MQNAERSVIMTNKAVSGEYEYFTCYSENGLCRRKIGEKRAEKIFVFKDEPIDAINLFSNIFSYNNKLVLIPAEAKNIHLYDINSGVEEIISIAEYSENNYFNINHMFESSFMINDCLYLLGCTFPGIVIIDLSYMSVSCAEFLLKDKNGKSIDVTNGCFYKAIVYDNCIWAGCMSAPLIIKYVPENNKYEYIYIDTCLKGFNSIYVDDKTIYLTSRDKNKSAIVGYDISNELTFEISLDSNRFNPFGDIIKYKNIFFMFPEAEKHIYCFKDFDDLRIYEPGDDAFSEERAFTIGGSVCENMLCFCTTDDNITHCINMDSETMESYKILLDCNNEVIKEEIIGHGKAGNILVEGDYSLKDFISSIEYISE